MPDFERHFDSLWIDLSRRRRRRVATGYWLGYARGKTMARLQIAGLAVAAAVVFLILHLTEAV